ncbi:hypothetical protein QKU48_gp0282 [Fadolivirus algeromassiliense]|jgi:hypothetical protein|uniref:Uncharacterized protein n=1 Tax=Fadolivirus FV1/VV64 TaxID=3070911 RepID=A0A7D3QWR0_9VIRU|nr:hypothetical protein QKU48_gp0282 [Fadolivirus algeromassiliense]QKF93740.1 hypothetical protein Fadolivirus_1_282 [Fadolivirus FV1/VV64]
MILSIKTNNYTINCSLSFDIFGNIYLHDIDKNNTYQLNINGKNTPYLEQGNYDIIEKNTRNPNKFTLLDKNTSLRAKIKKMQKKHELTQNDENDNSDDEYDLDGDKNIPDYYPEDNDHINNDLESEDDIYDEDNINKYGTQNIKFNFWNSSTDINIEINNRKDGDISALYDTFIYDEYNNLIFKSTSHDEYSIYRIKIFSNGDIFFRPIGYSEHKYKIEYNVSGDLCLSIVN